VTKEWQVAMEALILVAENGGPTMLARIGAEPPSDDRAFSNLARLG
jgi:hypothetical protein